MRCPRWLWAFIVPAVLAPAAQGQLVVPDLTHECVLRQGERCRGAIEIINTGEEPAAVEIRRADYLFDADGNNRYPPPGSEERSNADWIRLQPAEGRVTVAPEGSVNIAYTVRVPDEPQLAGTYWSVVLVDPVSEHEEVDVGYGVRIRQGIGYGVQLITHIGDSGERAVQMLSTRTRRVNGETVLLVDLANTGQRWLRPVVQAAVHQPTGEPLGRFDSARRRVFPGCSVRFHLRLSGLESGNYLVALIVDNLDEHVWATDISLEVE